MEYTEAITDMMNHCKDMLLDKHVVSVHDFVNKTAKGREIPLDSWKEKIGDNINYLILLWAMVNVGR